MESYGHESEFGGTFIFARRRPVRNRVASTHGKRYTSRSCDRISIECSVSGATVVLFANERCPASERSLRRAKLM